MNYVTIGMGTVAVLYGILTMILRIKSPEKFGKLEAMKKRFGSTMGLVIHIFAYSVLPILFGLFSIFVGMNNQ
jgi:hypothetical protein